jgi:hypothetical protein
MEGHQGPAQSVFFKPQEVVVTDTWPPPSIPMVATPTRPAASQHQHQHQHQHQRHPQQSPQADPAEVSWHTLHGVSSSWGRNYGGRSAGVHQYAAGRGFDVDPQPPPPPAEIASGWGEAAELEALYHTRVAETLHHVEVAKRLRGRLVASRDALAVRRQCVIDNRAAAIASLQRQFTELQNQLLCELRRAVGDVETAEHAAVRPLEAEMDGMVQRVQDIDRLAELTSLKIRCEPKHKFIEYARLLQQDLAAATVRNPQWIACRPHQIVSAAELRSCGVLLVGRRTSVVLCAGRPGPGHFFPSQRRGDTDAFASSNLCRHR